MSSNKLHSQYEWLFERGINTKQRVIYINSEICDFSFENIMIGFDLFEQTRDKPIRIDISSFGGSIYDMFGIVDRIRMSPCEVITRVFGKAMSAATLIAASGDKRQITKNSWFMMHEPSDIISGKVKEIRNDYIHLKELEKQMYNQYEEFSGGKLTEEQFKRLCSIDRYLPAQKVVDFGLADEII